MNKHLGQLAHDVAKHMFGFTSALLLVTGVGSMPVIVIKVFESLVVCSFVTLKFK